MRVYAATFAQLVGDDAKLAIIFPDREARQLSPVAPMRRGGVARADKDRTGTRSVDHAFAIHR
jgi:hypothetical protein